MIILNAIDGKVFDLEGNLLNDVWPENGYQRCPRSHDRELFKLLEGAQWTLPPGFEVCASVRWWEREEDQPMRGSKFKKGTFGLRGSGIWFYLLHSGLSLTEDNLVFLCEIPWKNLFETGNGEAHAFVGEEALKEAIRAKVTERKDRIRKRIEMHSKKLEEARKDSWGVWVTLRHL